MAQCVDVDREPLSSSDRFVLDTNVIIDVTLVGTSREIAGAYSRFLARVLRARARVFVPAIAVYEIASVIEATSFHRLRGRRHETRSELKEFRSDRAARRVVVGEVRRIWNEVESFAEVLPISVDAALVARSLDMLSQTPLDGYDLPIALAARAAGIGSIVTHDADFQSLDGCVIFTANRRMLA